MVCRFEGRLTIWDGELAQVEAQLPRSDGEAVLTALDESDWRGTGCEDALMTADQMYLRVRSELSELGILGGPIYVGFDPSWGFITQYRYGRSHYGGILGFSVSECCTLYEYTNLQPIEP
jgi:hypothetical protein